MYLPLAVSISVRSNSMPMIDYAFVYVLSRSRVFLLSRLSKRAAGNGVLGTLRLRSYDNYGTFHQTRVFLITNKFLQSH